MPLQNYARLKVLIDGTEMTQITSLQMTTASGNQVVNLMGEGLGGFTEGSGSVSIEIGYAIPIGGTEYDYQVACAAKRFVTVQLVQGSNQYVGTGKFDEDSFSQSAGANAEGTITWMGELNEFQTI